MKQQDAQRFVNQANAYRQQLVARRVLAPFDDDLAVDTVTLNIIHNALTNIAFEKSDVFDRLDPESCPARRLQDFGHLVRIGKSEWPWCLRGGRRCASGNQRGKSGRVHVVKGHRVSRKVRSHAAAAVTLAGGSSGGRPGGRHFWWRPGA